MSRKSIMAKRDREKLKKAKARKDKRAKAAKTARDEAKAAGDPTTQDQAAAFAANNPFGVDSVGRSTGDSGSPRLPRRNKKG